MADAAAAPADGGVGRAPRTSLGIIFLVLFIDLVGFSMVFPLFGQMLTFYQAHDEGLLHAGLTWVGGLMPQASTMQRAALFGGVLAALYSGLQFVFAPVWGRLSDRYGRRPILLLSIVGTTTAYGLWIISSSFSLLLISRIIAGTMTGNIAVANAAAADISSPAKRSSAMAVLGIAFGLGFVIGPALGGGSWVFSAHHLPGLSDPANRWLNPFSLTAGIAFALSLINLVWALARFEETLPPERRQAQAPQTRTINPAQILDPSLGAGVARINLAFLLYTVLFACLESTLVFLTAEKRSFTPGTNACLFVWMGLVSALVQGGIFRRLAGRYGVRPFVLIGFVVMLPGFLCIGLIDWFPSTALLALGATILACGSALVFPGLNTMVSLAGDAQRQGWVMGTFRSAGALGRALGPLLGALLYFTIRPAAPYVFGALGMLVPLYLIAQLRGKGAERPTGDAAA